VRDKNCDGSIVATFGTTRYSNIVLQERSIRQGLAVPDEKDVLGGNEETGGVSRGALVLDDGLFHAGNTDSRIKPEAKGLIRIKFRRYETKDEKERASKRV
jgi:hypothetical protein